MLLKASILPLLELVLYKKFICLYGFTNQKSFDNYSFSYPFFNLKKIEKSKTITKAIATAIDMILIIFIKGGTPDLLSSGGSGYFSRLFFMILIFIFLIKNCARKKDINRRLQYHCYIKTLVKITR